jgi:predicted AlkP superfamily phosphohydrolase/phosphomutase
MARRLPSRHRNPRNIGARGLMGDLDWSATRAYTTSFSSHGVRINLAGREPYGVVAPGDEYEALLSEIQTELLALRDPTTGSPILDQVIRASDLYHGPMLDRGPDLLVVPAQGFGSCSGEAGAHLSPLRKWMGSHDLDGILVASGPGIRPGHNISHASIMDIAPTTLYLAGVPIPVDVDGQVLGLFADSRLKERPPSYEEVRYAQSAREVVFTPEEQDQLEAHLRSLGYL